jgi:hypothetical protein
MKLDSGLRRNDLALRPVVGNHSRWEEIDFLNSPIRLNDLTRRLVSRSLLGLLQNDFFNSRQAVGDPTLIIQGHVNARMNSRLRKRQARLAGGYGAKLTAADVDIRRARSHCKGSVEDVSIHARAACNRVQSGPNG